MLDMKLFNGENDPLEEKQVQNKPSTFGQILDNVGAWGNAAYANTREIGLSEDIRDLYERLYNGDYTSDEEYNRLSEEFQKKQDERRKYKQEYEENMKVLNQNDSYLKDFTEIGGTVQGIGTQLKDTAMAAGAGAVTMGALGAGAGGIGAIPAALVGAAKGATWGNRVGAFHQAYQDAKVNAIDAWEKVLQEGGTAEQAEQAYNDALIANLPTEALDVIGNLYFGSKILGNAVSSNMAQKLSKSALGKTAEKVSRFDLPEVVGTNVAKKFGTTAGKIAGGVTASTLEGIGESIQEPWQDYATERAVDIQRRQYDPTNKLNKDVRDFSVLGDGGLLDYYTTPEGRETAWKSFKMGAAFGGVGSALSASQFTGLGTAHQDSIDASRQLASEFSEGGELFGTDKNYDDVRKMMGNIYGLTEDERDSLSKEDVYRMYVDYWTNKYSSGGLFGSGNRQEVNAVMQADLINALTGQETNRTDQLNDYSRKYVNKYALNPDNSIFNDIKQRQEEQLNQEEQVQEAVEQSEQNNGEDVAMTGKFREGNFSPETAEEAKERNGGVLGSVKNAVNGVIDKVAKKSEWYDLPDKFGKQWVWADDGMDSDDNRTYRNTETGRLANVERVKVGKKGKYNRYTYRVKDITNGRNDPNTIGVGGYAGVGDKSRNNEFTNVKQVEKYLNLRRTNRDTSFMADSQHGNEQAGIKQTLPQEDGVIASKDIQKDAEGNEVYNGRVIQSKDAVNVHSMDDLDTYFREHGDLMSTDLYAEVARGMMRFGIGKDNKTSIVLDLANDKSGALGSKTTWMENPNDPNSAIAKAVIRLYAGADLVTAAHEIAHLGWINLSDQDKNTFARWAIDTEEEFVARVLGFEYNENFSAYLLEALTTQGEGGSLGSQALWQKIKEQGATKQTIDILNKHANDQNIADAIDERFAWEFSNWFAQGYIKGEKPHNVIERILQKACQSMGDALRLLYDTDRYLNDKNYRLGASGRDVGDIFNRISASRKDRGQQTIMPQQEEPVSLRTEMRQPVEAPYNLGQGFDEAEYTSLDEDSSQNLGRNIGTIAGTSPVATTPVTQEEDPEPKKKRSKEHKEWEKRQQEKKEAQEKAIKDARDNVKTKLNAAKDLYNKKASVEDLTKAVDELYGAAMSAKDLSNEKEHTDLIKDALKKVSQFRSKIDELRKKKPQTVKYTPPMTEEERSQYLTPDDVYNYINNMQGEEPRTPISEGTPATSPEGQYMSDIINDRTGQQEQPTKPTREDFSSPQWGDQYGEDELLKKILGDKEGMTKTQGIEGLQKQEADKLKKDIKSNIDKANKSLNAKSSKLSLEDVSKLISSAEESLNKYKNMDSVYYDEKTAGEFEKAIETLKKKLEEKQKAEQQISDEEFKSGLKRLEGLKLFTTRMDGIHYNLDKIQNELYGDKKLTDKQKKDLQDAINDVVLKNYKKWKSERQKELDKIIEDMLNDNSINTSDEVFERIGEMEKNEEISIKEADYIGNEIGRRFDYDAFLEEILDTDNFESLEAAIKYIEEDDGTNHKYTDQKFTKEEKEELKKAARQAWAEKEESSINIEDIKNDSVEVNGETYYRYIDRSTPRYFDKNGTEIKSGSSLHGDIEYEFGEKDYVEEINEGIKRNTEEVLQTESLSQDFYKALENTFLASSSSNVPIINNTFYGQHVYNETADETWERYLKSHVPTISENVRDTKFGRKNDVIRELTESEAKTFTRIWNVYDATESYHSTDEAKKAIKDILKKLKDKFKIESGEVNDYDLLTPSQKKLVDSVSNEEGVKDLSAYGKLVYAETLNKFNKSKADAVQDLARENAIIHARMCERIAKMRNEENVRRTGDDEDHKYNAKMIADEISVHANAGQASGLYGKFSHRRYVNNFFHPKLLDRVIDKTIRLYRRTTPSTFIHESTHWYQLELEMVAEQSPNGQAAKDLKTLYEWAEYKGKEEEMKYLDQMVDEERRVYISYMNDIENARTQSAREKALIEWRDEKIARAFEEYVRGSDAPIKKLKDVFERFKAWLLKFYSDMKQISVEPSPEVKEVFDRMILTDKEFSEKYGNGRTGNQTQGKITEQIQEKIDELISKLDKKYKTISIKGIRKLYPFNKREKEDIQFWTGEIREALVNGKDLSQFDKRIHQHTIDNVGTPNWEVRDVEKYVTNYLNDAKKMQQEINKIKSVTNANQSDTKMQASSKEEIAKNRKPTVWSISATGGKTAIRRSKFGVGKDVSGQIYFHKDYAEDVIPLKDLKKARDIAHREGFTEDKYNCMMYDTHTGVIRFDEAPDFDTHREPITGKYLRVYPDGHTEASKGGANQERQIWHHKWLWVKEDYKGFDVQASRDWSEKWLEANKGKGRPSGKKSEWDKKLRDIGLGKYIEDTKMQEVSTGFVKQESGNPRSSQNQIPAVMTHVEWKKGTVNADIGGGKYDTATNYMKEQGVDSSVFDPYNRTPEHNLERFNAIQEAINKHGGVDTVTVANVLNVIPDEWNMLNVIHQAAEAVKQDGVAYFYVYENKKDNIVREVKGRGVQRNEVTEKYEPRVKQFFDDVNVVTKKKETLQNGKKKTSSCKVIEARKPKFMPDNRAFWTMNANSNDTSANNIKQLDLSKKNAEHTALQVASKNAQNQTRLNAKSEQVLEKLFRRLVRDKKITDAPWNKGNIDRLKKYTNIADKGTVPRDLKLNPNDKRTMDAEYLDALQKVNDYLHEKYPYLKNIYRGADGHWRFEFSDKDAQLVDGLDEREKVTTLGKVLKHDNLYKFYPKLKNMHVSIVSNERMNRIMGDNPNSEYDGAYDPTSKYIYLNKDSFKEEDMRKVLLHEVQHAIQDIEGLANGDSAFNEENYETSAGEREANQTEERADMSNEELQNNPRRTNPKEKTVLSDVRAITDTKMQEKSTPLERTKALQELANRINNNMVELNVESYDDPKAREFMDNELRTYGWTFDEIKELHNRIRLARDTINKMREQYPLLNDWESKAVDTDNKDFIKTVRKVQQVIQKTVPVDNPFISNGDYTLNTDFGTMCMKKEAMDAAVQIIMDMGLGQNLGSSQMELIKDILIKYKMITPCDMCFVEAKRARVLSDANKSAYDWKSVLIAAKIYTKDKDGKMKFLPLGTDRSKGSGNELTEEQIERLQKMADKSKKNGQPYKEAFEKWMPEDRRRHKDSSDSDLDTGTTADKMAKIAKLILEDHSLAGELNPLDLVSTRGIDKLFLGYGGHTGIVPTFSGMYGSATSKPIQSFRLFDPRAWLYISEEYGDNKIKRSLGIKGRVGSKEWLKNAREGIIDKDRITESVYDFGGMRLQSFSDYNPILFFDYCQFIADCEGRYLPMHTYTKVPYLVELFNQTRMMMNMSFIPEVVVDLKHDKLDENGKLKHAGLKYNPETGEFDLYAWHKDSFPIELGYEYRKKYDYAGTIAVGISDAHIRKMMADPEIDMIIPYHKSGMPLNVQIKTGLVYAKSYEYAQTIGIDDEAKKKFAKEHYSNYEKKMQGTPDQIKRFLNSVGERMAKVDLNYSRLLFKEGDPHKAAQKYLDLCKKYGCTPVFEDFAYKNNDKEACIANQGYYKMLEDFRGYDTKGNAILQKPVQLKFPEGFEKVLEKSISDRTKMKEHMNKMLKNEDFLKDLKKALEPQRIDGEIRTQMMKGLRSALGQNNVVTLAKKEFFDELEKYYQSGLTEEEAKAKVEVFRQMNGTVYGFARNNKIYLNENVFNAGTPAHEFTHVWARVAQNMNEKLWNEGVRILKEEASDLWHEVENSSLYGNIADNDNAIASEVLARLVAKENVDFIKQQLEPNKTMGRGKGLVARIKIWCMQMFDSVRSIFDNIDDKPLTFDEFVKMPLKALWDTDTNTEFRNKTKEVIDSYSLPMSKEQTYEDVYTNQSNTKMQEKSVQRPLNQQRAITILDGKYQDGKTINFTNEILDRKKKGETRTTKTLTRNEDLGITNDKQNVVGVIRLGDPRPLRKYDENGNKTQDYIDSMIEGTDYDIDDNNLDKEGKQKYFYPITVVKDFRKNPMKITKHVSQAYKEYDASNSKFNPRNSDTKLQDKSVPKTYPDQNKDVYSVTFTKSAQRVGENQKKMAFYRKNDSYWRENKNKDGSITFTRKLPYRHHQRTLVYDDINGLTVGKKKKTKFREYYEAVKDQLIKWWFNDKHFLYKAAKNAGALNSYMRMMVMKDQGAVASAAIEDGIVKHNSKKGERTKSLNSIIEAVGEANQTDFLNYCEAFRIRDLHKRGIKQKMDLDLAEKEIAKVKNSKNAKLFEQQRQYFVEYNHELLWVLVDGGFITEEQYDKFIEVDPNFVPLSKNMEELEDYVGGIGVSKKMINAEHPIHKIGTSMREVKNPFLEMQRRTVEYYVKASRNKAGRIFVDDIAGAIARGANGNVVAINQGMVRKLKSRDQNGNPISMDGKQNIFYVWNEGEKEYYQVADREIYEALRSFDSEQMGALKKIVDQTLGRTSRLVRNTATMTPDFGLRNLCRDNVEAFISSEHGFLPFIDAFWGMYQMANDTQWFREYQQMNGEPFNTLNRDGEDVATVEHDVKDNIKIWKTYFPLIKKDFREFTDKNRSVPARAKSLLLLGTDVVGLHSLYKMNKKLNDYMEVGTRIGEYRNARMGYHGLYGRLFEGKVKGNRIFTNDKDLVYATNDELFSAYKSKDITLNFGQHGTIGKELNRIIPFFNASLQGIYKIGNTIDNMVHGDDNRIREELLFKCILMGAMGMAAALAGQGDDDYEEAPEYEHESFWILPNGVRIAKDQLFGRLVGNTVEKATRQYLKDGDVKKMELVQDILGNFMIDKCVPALVDLGWGTVGNYDSFRKKSVTPEYMADKLGYLQKDLSTSKAGVDISEALYKVFGIDVGAKKVDFVISKTLSNLGKYATNLYELTGDNQKMTRGAEPEDKGGFSEWSKELPYPMNTIVGTFATNRNSFQSISDFYERYRELKKLSSDESIMSKNEKKAWNAYQQAYKQDKKFRDALKAIKQDKSLTGAQKRQKADKIFKQQISMSRKLHDWEKKHGLI